MNEIDKEKIIFKALAVATLSIVAFGTIFFHIVEKWSYLDAYYFSVITLSTVGYGDFSPQTNVGKIATTIFIFVGVGIIAGFIQVWVKKQRHRVKKVNKDKS